MGDLYRRGGKRMLDLVVVVCLCPIVVLLFLVTALAVRVFLGSPVFFRQPRPGLREVPFTLLKFRTMTEGRSSTGELLTDGERLTRFGRFLRRTSLDELPEVLNVLKGEMSLVGPRPLLMEYLGRYSPEQRRRHDVLPGITGWAQVNGRNAITWAQKFALDVWYVDHQSLALDLTVLLRTVLQACRADEVNQPGKATVDGFRGEQ